MEVYPLVMSKIAIENDDFPVHYVSLPESKPAIPGKSNGKTDHFYLPDAVDEEVRCDENPSC